MQFSLATAAGLFKSAISFILIVVSYIIAYKAADYKIFLSPSVREYNLYICKGGIHMIQSKINRKQNI